MDIGHQEVVSLRFDSLRETRYPIPIVTDVVIRVLAQSISKK